MEFGTYRLSWLGNPVGLNLSCVSWGGAVSWTRVCAVCGDAYSHVYYPSQSKVKCGCGVFVDVPQLSTTRYSRQVPAEEFQAELVERRKRGGRKHPPLDYEELS